MTPDRIKQKIEVLLEKYHKNSGTVKGFEVVFEYVDFIKSEPYTASLLKNQFEYAQTQMSLLDKYIDQRFKGDVPNVHKIMEFKDISELPIHQEYLTIGLEQRKNKEHANMEQMLPLAITQLVMVYEAMGRVKEQMRNQEKIDNKLKILKELPTATMRAKVGEELSSMPFIQFARTNLSISAKYIIDQIDCEELAGGSEAKKEPWFDKDKSILHLMGESVKITLKNDPPLDHYLLEALFKDEDLSDKAFFSEISQDILNEEYNGGWQRFRHACDRLNRKIAKATNNKITNFIEYTTGRTGWCRIRGKYL